MLYLLRVGADSIYGGFHSPIFQDLSYLFIPIPDNNVLKEKSIRYSEYKWNNQNILSYIPIKLMKKLSSYTIHNDPEFVTCTYGSPKYDKRGIEKNYKKLLNLKKNDLLVFYAAFSNKFEDLKIDKKLTDRSKAKKAIKGRLKNNYEYKITIKNLNKATEDLTLYDKVPHSSSENIKVEIGEIVPEPDKKKLGVLTWKFNLKGLDEKNINYKYVVDYKKGIQITPSLP